MRSLIHCLPLVILAGTTVAGSPQGGTCPSITPSPEWKDAIDFPDDPFRADSGPFGEPGWVKFTTLVCDGLPVYYQDSVAYAFHFDFAVARLDPFFGLTLPEFQALTMFNSGREALLGAVVLPPLFGPEFPEYGIQLISQDPLDVQDVIDHFNAARNSVNADPGVQAFYFPTFEQLESTLANEATLNANGIQISSPARWSTGNSIYSQGWALGRLRFVRGANIEDEFLAGTLLPSDILLTDAVPADAPLFAGVVSLGPATPNSHIAILASTFQVPFVYLSVETDIQNALALDGRLIALNAFQGDPLFGFQQTIDLIDAQDELTDQQIGEILALRAPPPLNIQRTQTFGGYTAPTDGLVQSDIGFFGGKAANFGFLRRAIPNNSPVSLGISFDLWDEFLTQTMGSGLTLRQEIDALLAPYTTFPPPDLLAMATDLDVIQDMIEDDTSFTLAQETGILLALQDPQYVFDPSQRIRFRSSTNVEDSDQFTGAGLYDSKSGCLADELDGDRVGPSLCEPDEPDERGVFRAIRKVYASFYNDNAFLERLRHSVDEHEVGMALLVHHSFPDELELANGVATLDTTGFGNDITLVSQAGAESVTNPEGDAVPEVVDVFTFNQSFFVTLVQSSNLVQLGDTVLEFTQEYEDLAELLVDVGTQFELETGKTDYVLDFEYKKVAPSGDLIIKQVREIPQPDTTPSITPFLLNRPTEYIVLQGHAGNVFANHRLKLSGIVETRNIWLDAPSLAAQTLFADVELELFDGCRVDDHLGLFSGLPSFTHAYDRTVPVTVDGWAAPDAFNPRSLELSVRNVGQLVAQSQTPILTISNLGLQAEERLLELRGEFSLPVSIVQEIHPDPPSIGSTTTAEVLLTPRWDDDSSDEYRQQVFDVGGGVTITTGYWLHPLPGVCAGCIFPLAQWEMTMIEGLTTTPIVLTSDYAQSYEAGQHNFIEQFVFEPRLDPSVSPAQVAELEAQGIGMIWARTSFSSMFEVLYLPPDPCEPSCGSVNYCAAAPHSSGPGALISVSGSTSIAANDFSLVVTGAPPNAAGLFYYGDARVQAPFGDGLRCVGADQLGVFRLNPPLFTDDTGGATRSVSYGPGRIVAGSTWNFQFWYRDADAGGRGSTFRMRWL